MAKKTQANSRFRLVKEVRSALVAVKPDVLLEFRQRYTGPAIRQYGNMLRANDCPSDILGNRRRIIDLRIASGKTAVHSDMLVWSPVDAGRSRELYVVNASHRKGVAIRFDKGAFRVVELFDALGRPVGEFRPTVDGGLADIPIPECGYAAIRGS